MIVGYPLAFWFLAVAAPILLLLIGHRRARNSPVPYLRLWDDLIDQSRADRLFQRLRRPVAWLLPLLLLALMVLAAADLHRSPVRRVILLDCSASMTTVELNGESRFALARREALRLVEQAAGNDTIMIVTAARQPQLLEPFTRNRRRLREALERVRPTLEEADLAEAIRFARQVGAGPEPAQIDLISDHASDDPAVRSIRVGEATENIGIAQFSARTLLGITYLQLAIENYGRTDREIAYEIVRLGADRREAVVERFRARLAAGQRFDRVLNAPSGSAYRLRITDPAREPFVADNVAWATVPTGRRLKLLLVSRPGRAVFIAATLASLAPEVEPIAMEPAAYAALSEQEREADLTLFNQVTVPVRPPGAALFIDCTGPGLPVEILERPLRSPAVRDWDREHPVNRFIDYRDLEIRSARRLRLPQGSRPLVWSEAGPLIVLTERPEGRSVTVGFDPYPGGSAFAAQSSFPIFLANLIHWLGGSADRSGTVAHQPGEPIRSAEPLPEAVKQVSVRYLGADEPPTTLPVSDGTYGFTRTDRPGLYEIRAGSTRSIARVNALSAREGRIASSADVEPPVAPTLRPGGERPWRLLVIGAILLLAVEWFFYQKQWIE